MKLPEASPIAFASPAPAPTTNSTFPSGFHESPAFWACALVAAPASTKIAVVSAVTCASCIFFFQLGTCWRQVKPLPPTDAGYNHNLTALNVVQPQFGLCVEPGKKILTR